MKKHLNIDADFHDDDAYIIALGEAAEMLVERNIGYSLSHYCDSYTGMLAAPLMHAMLLLVGNFYMNRESVTSNATAELPLAYRYIIELFENYDVWG